MPCPRLISDLVQKFRLNYSQYKSPDYNETSVRREFIDPFFKSLGWDIDNESGFDEEFKDVVHEDAIRVGDSARAPDYSFRIGGRRVFFVEAKKPAVNLKETPDPAFQVRRYGYSAQLKVSILTDFEEFSVYDVTVKPSLSEKASTRRLMYFTFDQYEEKWDEISALFSKDAVQRGSIRRFAENLTAGKSQRGTQGLDKDFLAEIEGWRNVFARNIALRNKDLTQPELNLAVQMTIDRILFLRICEDRGIEPFGQLQRAIEGTDHYQSLVSLFRDADAKYNSGLFHFSKEEGREDPDNLTLSLIIDDSVLKEVIRNLYWPTPYVFSEIPAVILGQVYEQFLGKVIRLTPGHQAKVEDKPEVKKAGGVFYTPEYIVDYIVSQTVGRLVEGKTPREVSDIRILDPACGSGSFLIGAYQFLLTWHKAWYTTHLVPLLLAKKKATDPEVQKLIPVISRAGRKGKRSSVEYPLPIYPVSDTNWQLTTTEKKRILLNCVYGVDIDRQAVEVTKLSLLLKVLEGESGERIGQKKLITDRVLPTLEQNIRCGNSLISTDILAGGPLDPDVVRAINPFDWDVGFPEIMQAGGFDAVIGNPPYVRQELLKGFKEYFSTHYVTFQGTADLYVFFVERGISLLREGGYFSYIVANKWMRAAYGKPLRKWLKEQQIEEIIDFGDLPVFEKATTYPCIIRVSKRQRDDRIRAVNVKSLDFLSLDQYLQENEFELSQQGLDEKGWALVDEKERALLDKIRSVGVPLGEYVGGKIYYGIKTGLNKAFVIDEETRDRLIAEDPRSAEVIKPFLAGRDIKRYQPLTNHGKYLIFTRHGIDINQYPAIKEYLNQFKAELMPRPSDYVGTGWRGRKPGKYKWYEIQDTIDYYEEFEKPKIFYPDISVRNSFTPDNEGKFYGANTTYFIPFYSEYLLGILNSKLLTFYYSSVAALLRGGYLRFFSQYIEELPIPPLKSTNSGLHDQIVTHVTQILDLHRQLAVARLPQDRDLIQRQIDAIDRAIDTIVYDLYGLNEDERKLIERVVQHG